MNHGGICEECGGHFTGRKRKFCDMNCLWTNTKERRKLVKILIEKMCVHCGIKFFTLRKEQKYCTRKCGRELSLTNKRNRRRAKIKGAKIIEKFSYLEIFERDDWICQSCGIKTLKLTDKMFLDPKAPELDHVIPLSRGGDHIASNVQLLCRKCNRIKNNKIPRDVILSQNAIHREQQRQLKRMNGPSCWIVS